MCRGLEERVPSRVVGASSSSKGGGRGSSRQFVPKLEEFRVVVHVCHTHTKKKTILCVSLFIMCSVCIFIYLFNLPGRRQERAACCLLQSPLLVPPLNHLSSFPSFILLACIIFFSVLFFFASYVILGLCFCSS